MLKIWKEFFRLKCEEISYWWSDIEWGEIFCLIYLIIVACSIVFLIGHLVLIIPGFNPYGIGDTFFCGLSTTILLIIVFLIIKYFFVIPIKWLISNWKQAKENVKKK